MPGTQHLCRGTTSTISGGPGCGSPCAGPPDRTSISREPDGGRPESWRRPEKAPGQPHSRRETGEGRRAGRPDAGRQAGSTVRGRRTGPARTPNLMVWSVSGTVKKIYSGRFEFFTFLCVAHCSTSGGRCRRRNRTTGFWRRARCQESGISSGLPSLPMLPGSAVLTIRSSPRLTQIPRRSVASGGRPAGRCRRRTGPARTLQPHGVSSFYGCGFCHGAGDPPNSPPRRGSLFPGEPVAGSQCRCHLLERLHDLSCSSPSWTYYLSSTDPHFDLIGGRLDAGRYV